MIDLTVTIVNYNTKDLLKNCINSIYSNTTNISFEIIVIDNSSNDNSIGMLKKEFPEVKIIANDTNLFFARAHNQALKISTGRYQMLLNSDTVILNNAFDKMIKFMNEHPECGACGPKLYNPDNSIQQNGNRFPTLFYAIFELSFINTIWKHNPVKNQYTYYGWDRTTINEVDYISGCCALVRLETINQVGILDEGFLIYWSETDWQYRMKKSGWKIYFLPEAQIIHYWSAGMDKHRRETKDKIFNDSLLYYYKKHFGFIYYFWLLLLLNLFNRPILKIVRWIKKYL